MLLLAKKILEPFLPVPVVIATIRQHLRSRSQSPEIRGTACAPSPEISACCLRALAYTLAYGSGIRQATEDAVLNANYIRKKI